MKRRYLREIGHTRVSVLIKIECLEDPYIYSSFQADTKKMFDDQGMYISTRC